MLGFGSAVNCCKLAKELALLALGTKPAAVVADELEAWPFAGVPADAPYQRMLAYLQ